MISDLRERQPRDENLNAANPMREYELDPSSINSLFAALLIRQMIRIVLA